MRNAAGPHPHGFGFSSARFSVLALSSFARCPPLAGSLRTAARRARSFISAVGPHPHGRVTPCFALRHS